MSGWPRLKNSQSLERVPYMPQARIATVDALGAGPVRSSPAVGLDPAGHRRIGPVPPTVCVCSELLE
jgi:hypothetical protein